MNKSEQLIACLEGEIAKRDARIVELEHRCGVYGLELHNATERLQQAERQIKAIKAQEPVAFAFRYDDGSWHDVSSTQHSAGMVSLYTTPVSDAKAQGVVMPERETELFNAAYGAAVESGWESVKCMARQIWDAARLNAAPAAPAADAGVTSHD